MPPVVIDLVLCGLILGLTYALMSEGLWGAALMFFNVVFAGIIAFNFYEPLAKILADNMGFMAGFADVVCLMAIFVVALVILRLTTETLAPAMVRFPTPVYHLGRILFGLAGAVVTVAICLLAYESAPVHKKVFGVVDHQYAPPFKLGLDRNWLGFFQYTTGYIFAKGGRSNDPFGEYKDASNLFDPRAEWLLNHQDARPYGTETVLSGGGAEGAEGGGSGAGGGAPGAAGGGRPGDPQIIGSGSGFPVVAPN
jgi:hypothetical protein